MTYTFKTSGQIMPSGIKIRCSGEVTGPSGYPMEVFEAARKAVLETFPGIKLKGEAHGLVRFPTLTAKKVRLKK